MIKFAVKKGYSDAEIKALAIYATLERKIKLEYFNTAQDVPETHIPVGSIEWIIENLGYVPRPDYYPKFLEKYLYRKVWKSNNWPMEKGVFIKPYDQPKRYEARITTGTYKGKKKGPHWCSERVKFICEWRYYIVNSKLLDVEFYQGNPDLLPNTEEGKHYPGLDLSSFPEKWCGCVDMGFLDTGIIVLVEAGEPYSMGWYPGLEKGGLLAEFLIEGWKFLKRRPKDY